MPTIRHMSARGMLLANETAACSPLHVQTKPPGMLFMENLCLDIS